MSDTPTVTVLIPARNEEADIERCLRAVLDQDHPHDRMDIVLVDGGSTDMTAAAAEAVLFEGDVAWRIVRNEVGTTPSNLNQGLACATGEYLCRVDARSLIPPQYVRLCVELLQSRPELGVTGGAQIAIAPEDSAFGRGVARALNNRFLMGGSRYRRGAPSGPTDTVYLGAFRTSDLRGVGGWDEAMLTNQDFELNRRLGRQRVVWFDDRISVRYIPRSSLLELWRQYHRFGRWKVRYWRHAKAAPEPRQQVLLAIPLACGLALLASARKRPCMAGVTAVSASVAIEHLGGPPETYHLPERVMSQAAMVVVASGWWTGVVVELFQGGE